MTRPPLVYPHFVSLGGAHCCSLLYPAIMLLTLLANTDLVVFTGRIAISLIHGRTVSLPALNNINLATAYLAQKGRCLRDTSPVTISQLGN